MTNTIISEPLIHLSNVQKIYHHGNQTLPILINVSLTINTGERCALLGTSGSGKSTLLNILGLLDSADSGKYRFAGHDIADAVSDELASLRNRYIGFIFQSFNLMPRLSALDNVALPLRYRDVPRSEAQQRALHMLAKVGLKQRAHHRPADLSGGQRQRVAIARALVGEPSLILADEPTGNLDRSTADDIMELLLSLNRAHNVTLIVVTHDPAIAGRLDRQVRVTNGVVQEIFPCSA
ncbi:ABC transporter ATP-binding protein [Pseudomonas putida]|jgi:putative ABC transport system ATP-binding protein|uniref:ABC transporter ATP-binding protein n=1 Tax=Pseudomonas putida TaxID=303 RepID=UPI003D977BB7